MYLFVIILLIVFFLKKILLQPVRGIAHCFLVAQSIITTTNLNHVHNSRTMLYAEYNQRSAPHNPDPLWPLILPFLTAPIVTPSSPVIQPGIFSPSITPHSTNCLIPANT